MLSAVVIVNETIEKKTSDQLIKKLENAELTSVEGGRYDRYLTKLILAKQEKAQVDCNFFFPLIEDFASFSNVILNEKSFFGGGVVFFRRATLVGCHSKSLPF